MICLSFTKLMNGSEFDSPQHSFMSIMIYETLPRAKADKNDQLNRSNAGMRHVNYMGIYVTRNNNSEDIFKSKTSGKSKSNLPLVIF